MSIDSNVVPSFVRLSNDNNVADDDLQWLKSNAPFRTFTRNEFIKQTVFCLPPPEQGKTVKIPCHYDLSNDMMLWDRYLDSSVVHNFCFFYGCENETEKEMSSCESHSSCRAVRSKIAELGLLKYLRNYVALELDKQQSKKLKKRKYDQIESKFIIWVFPLLNAFYTLKNCISIQRKEDESNNYIVALHRSVLGRIYTLPILGAIDDSRVAEDPMDFFNVMSNDFSIISMRDNQLCFRALKSSADSSREGEFIGRINQDVVKICEWPASSFSIIKISVVGFSIECLSFIDSFFRAFGGNRCFVKGQNVDDYFYLFFKSNVRASLFSDFAALSTFLQIESMPKPVEDEVNFGELTGIDVGCTSSKYDEDANCVVQL